MKRAGKAAQQSEQEGRSPTLIRLPPTTITIAPSNIRQLDE